MFLSRMTGKRGTARAAVVGGVLLVVSAMVGGVAWGVGSITRAKRVDAVTTFYVNAAPGAGEQWVQLLDLGGVVVRGFCQADYMDPVTDPGYPYGVGMGGGVFVTNNSTQRVVVTAEPWDDDNLFWNDDMWLDPGESDPVFGVGQWVNEDDATDLGRGSVSTFAILSHGGVSATGILARSAAVDPGDPTVEGDEMGRCVFSIQARG
jgi:hypothetical protein